MSLLSGAIHAIGDVVAPVAKATGTAYDYLTPGTGSSYLTDVGNNIANPNVTLQSTMSNPSGFGIGAAFQPANNYSPQNDGTTTGTGQNGTTGQTGANGTVDTLRTTYNPADISYLDTQSGNLQRMLQSADTGLNNGLTALSDSYNSEQNKANLQRSRALEDYQAQELQNQKGKESSLNTVDTNARTLNNSLQRILGMASGSGSSAYQFAAPNAVARQASGQRTNVLDNFGTNTAALTTAEDRAKVDFQTLLDNLAAQRNQKESDLRSRVLSNKNSIQDKLSQVAAQRAQALGGGTSAIAAAQQPFQNEINANQTALDNLFTQFRTPTYDVKPVAPQQVDLGKYSVDRAAINAQNQGGQAAYSPYSYFLKKQNDQNTPTAA